MIPALDAPLWSQLGRVLLHFLWQGALVALLAALYLRLLRDRDPRERYAVACLALVAMAALPAITFAWLEPAVHAHGVELAPAGATLPGPAAPGLLQWLAWSWLAGVLVQQLRLVIGYGRLSRLKRRGAKEAPQPWQTIMRELGVRLGVRRAVRLVISTRVSVPSLVGWLEPVVLLPVGALTSLSTAEVRAVLAHELAHFKRLDPLVNALQSVLEALLFFHPGVWWLSRRVRVEREFCCDDLAASACGDAVTLARALTNLESSRSSVGTLVLSSQGGSLMQRVRRLVQPQRPGGSRASLVVPALFATLAVALTTSSASAWTRASQDVCERCQQAKRARQGALVERIVWERFAPVVDTVEVSFEEPVRGHWNTTDLWINTIQEIEYEEAVEVEVETVVEWVEAIDLSLNQVVEWVEVSDDFTDLEEFSIEPVVVDFSVKREPTLDVHKKNPFHSYGETALLELDPAENVSHYKLFHEVPELENMVLEWVVSTDRRSGTWEVAEEQEEEVEEAAGNWVLFEQPEALDVPLGAWQLRTQPEAKSTSDLQQEIDRLRGEIERLQQRLERRKMGERIDRLRLMEVEETSDEPAKRRSSTR